LARHAATALVLIALASLLAAAAPARAQAMRYAGIVRSFDGTSLVLDDVGPGQDKGLEVSITSRTIAVTPQTALFAAIRAEDAQSGFPGDFRETRAEIADLEAGAFVTVLCQPEGPRCRALKVTIVRTARSESRARGAVRSPGWLSCSEDCAG
jgi:hypothetical protein